MDSLEGVLLVPPDRGQILGRAVWKPRHVVVGRRDSRKENQTSPSLPQLMTTSRIQASSPRHQPKPASTDYVLLIYKSKDDWEPTQQYLVSAVIDCQVQMIAHRKQGPVLPTLVIRIADKEKKRRSSRATGLVPVKEYTSTTLWFRTPPDDHHPSLHEWARFILSRKLPVSPESPVSPTFVNPFPGRPKDVEDYFPRSTSGNPNPRVPLQHKSSGQTHSSRDRPMAYSSESPSLRSRRSDLSSPASAAHPAYLGLPIHSQNYATIHPPDLPSPVATLGEYQGELIEGWTVAQGRTSTINSPVKDRHSDEQNSHPPPPQSSSPPAPRETILDRAFQMRCIPGSDREVPGEENLTSLARFDALMREADEERQRREEQEKLDRMATQSVWDMDDDSDEAVAEDEDEDDDDDEVEEGDDEGEYSEGAEHSRNDVDGRRRQRETLIPSTAQRALEFIANRHDRPPSPRSQHLLINGFDGDAISATSQNQALYRPQTGYSAKRLNMAQRTQSQPHLLPFPLDIQSSRKSEDGSRLSLEKRYSGPNAKRLSFTEFTKRLSSTSSLLLVQTNASGGNSSRASSEVDRNSPVLRSSLTARGASNPHQKGRDSEEHDQRCGFRSSVGVFSNDGGIV